MKHRKKILICLLLLVALTQQSDAATPDPVSEVPTTDYSAIWLRNVFDLKPTPEPVAAVTAPPPTPPPDVKMTGLVDLFHMKRALFLVKTKPEPGKPPTANPETSYIIGEGERKGMIEVVSIDFIGKKAQIKLDGTLMPIGLETNSASSGGGGAMHAGYNQRAAANPGMQPPPPPNNGGFPNGGVPSTSRTMRPSGVTSDNSGVQPYGQGGYVGGYGASSTPGLSLPSSSTSTSGISGQNTPQEPPASPEVTAAILAAQQAVAQNSGRPFPPLPFTLPGQNTQTQDPGTPPAAPNESAPLGSKITGTFPGLPTPSHR